MNINPKIFEHTEFGKIRAIEIDGQPWFIGKEITDALGYNNSRKALSDHVDKEDKNTVTIRDGIQGNPNKTAINESGLYSLILSSKLASAKRFKRWVTSEVLPSIRKHGAYILDAVLEEAAKNQEYADELFRKLQAEKEKSAAFKGYAEALAPKARYCDVVLMSGDALPISVIAKDYGMTAIDFNRLLHHLGIQYKLGGTWLLYKPFSGKGYTRTRTHVTPQGVCIIHTRWTQKGRLFLYDMLKSCGISPRMERGYEQTRFF